VDPLERDAEREGRGVADLGGDAAHRGTWLSQQVGGQCQAPAGEESRAELVEQDDPEILRLIRDGSLKKIVVGDALEDPRGCFLRITPTRRIGTYGIGMPIRKVLRDPLSAIGSVSLA